MDRGADCPICATALGAADPRNADSPVCCFADCQSAGRAVVRDGRESERAEIEKKCLLSPAPLLLSEEERVRKRDWCRGRTATVLRDKRPFRINQFGLMTPEQLAGRFLEALDALPGLGLFQPHIGQVNSASDNHRT